MNYYLNFKKVTLSEMDQKSLTEIQFLEKLNITNFKSKLLILSKEIHGIPQYFKFKVLIKTLAM